MMNKMSLNRGVKGEEQNRRAVITLINKIFIYSAIKIAAKGPPLYSVLNPDTSSDSPSAKSKGVRFVSAKAVVNQENRSAGSINIRGVIWLLNIWLKLREKSIINGQSIIRDILTS